MTYSNSILDHKIRNNSNKKIENRNVYNIININNKNATSSIGTIKEINFYNNNGYKNQTNTSYNFYDKIVGKIILNNNSENNNNINRIQEIKTDHINQRLLYINNINNKNMNSSNEKSKSKSKKYKNRKKGPKSIYANKRPSMPINKNKNNKKINYLNLNLNNINTVKKEAKEEKSLSNKKKINSLSKLFLAQNKNKNLIHINSSGTYNTYNNDSAKISKKSNLIPISLKHKILAINKPFK